MAASTTRDEVIPGSDKTMAVFKSEYYLNNVNSFVKIRSKNFAFFVHKQIVIKKSYSLEVLVD